MARPPIWRSPCCRARRSRRSPISRARRIGVTTLGSLTDWLTRKLSQQQGWGPDGIQVLPLGAVPARLAAMERNELDGMVIESATGYELEEQGKGRNILLFGDIEKHFYTHVIYATDDMIEKRAGAVAALPARLVQDRGLHEGEQGRRREVRRQGGRGAREHRRRRSTTPRSAVSRPTAPGTRQSIDVIRNSLKDLGILDFIPEAKVIYNDKFVPVKF